MEAVTLSEFLSQAGTGTGEVKLTVQAATLSSTGEAGYYISGRFTDQSGPELQGFAVRDMIITHPGGIAGRVTITAP